MTVRAVTALIGTATRVARVSLLLRLCCAVGSCHHRHHKLRQAGPRRHVLDRTAARLPLRSLLVLGLAKNPPQNQKQSKQGRSWPQSTLMPQALLPPLCIAFKETFCQEVASVLRTAAPAL